MGCCESKDKRQARETEEFEKSARSLIPQVVDANAGDASKNRIFFASYLFAITRELELTEQDALDLTARAVAADAKAEQEWSSFAPHRGEVLPDKRRSAIVGAWLRFDKDHSGDFDKKELEGLVNALNFPDSLARAIKKKLKESQKPKMTFADFEVVMSDLMNWEELQFIWTAASEGATTEPTYSVATHALTHDNVKNFLLHVQQENVDDADVQHFINKLGGSLSRSAFMKYLTDADFNSVIDSTRVERVYHDMTHPWQHYYINSSHNTYLSGDQLTSDSKPECYTKALVDGCRCVELDCWDGKDGRPIIYHGYTRTSKILFEDVIKAIEKDAFTTSQYPVILSLEVHTSIEQQETMAKIMRDVFGPKLALPTWQPGEPFEITPEAFKNKIIVKGKRLSKKQLSAVEAAEEEDDDDDDDDKPDDVKKAKADDKAKGKDTKPPKIAPGLSNVIIMESKHMKPFPEVLGLTMMGYEVVSLTESKSEGFAKKNLEQFMEHNSRRFTRVYPAGHRFDSSNYNPQPHWNAGAQVVALNWQTSESYELRLNKGKFIENGNSGYLLKPAYMLSGFALPATKGVVVEIEVISGFALPKPDGEQTGEVVDPYVKIFLEGPTADSGDVRKTEVIDDNGFHPVWHSQSAQPMKFTVRIPEATVLVLQVYDKDVDSDDFLAECFAPVHLIRSGVRCFPLRNVVSEQLPGSFVIARVKVTPA